MPDNNVGGNFEIQVLPSREIGQVQTSDPYRTNEVQVVTQANQPTKKNNLGTLLAGIFGSGLNFQAQAIDTTPTPQKDNSIIYILLAIFLIFGFAVYFSKRK